VKPVSWRKPILSSDRHAERTHRFHGEYKTPGGKLVVVDFSVHEEALAQVQIAGDFFLYPDDALHRLCASLERSSSTASVAERTSLLEASMAEGDVLIGLSSHAIAGAVERALTGSR
jgi:lipoate---protein ligase